MRETRSRHINVRMDDHELAAVEFLAEREDRSRSSMLRILISEALAARQAGLRPARERSPDDPPRLLTGEIDLMTLQL